MVKMSFRSLLVFMLIVASYSVSTNSYADRVFNNPHLDGNRVWYQYEKGADAFCEKKGYSHSTEYKHKKGVWDCTRKQGEKCVSTYQNDICIPRPRSKGGCFIYTSITCSSSSPAEVVHQEYIKPYMNRGPGNAGYINRCASFYGATGNDCSEKATRTIALEFCKSQGGIDWKTLEWDDPKGNIPCVEWTERVVGGKVKKWFRVRGACSQRMSKIVCKFRQ